MAKAASPEPRIFHESALIGDDLYVFGGMNAKRSLRFPRDEIWTCNVRDELKWIRHIAKGKDIPPPCEGAQCVVIDGIICSYGGFNKESGGLLGEFLGEVFGLDPKKMKWIKVATPIHGKKPWQRSDCCLWAIGGRLIMFGGWSRPIPQDRLQSGAQCNRSVNNEIYEFVFEEGREKGCWLDVELNGKRPQPRMGAAMETIDEHRGILHGGADNCNYYFDDIYVIDLKEKKWAEADCVPKPSARSHHRFCQLKCSVENNSLILFGGINIKQIEKLLDDSYKIVIEKRQATRLGLGQEITDVSYHTLHCIKRSDGLPQIIVVGGKNRRQEQKDMFFTAALSKESLLGSYSLVLSEQGNGNVCESERGNYQALEKENEELKTRCNALQQENNELKIQLKTLEKAHHDTLDALAKNQDKSHHEGGQTDTKRMPDASGSALDCEVTDAQRNQLASFFPAEWRPLARELLGDTKSIEAFERKHLDNPEEIAHIVLNKWHNQKASDATVKCICAVLVQSPVYNRKAAEKVFGVKAVEQ
ncbi:uncharacterized protein [Oscarella lobularis]